MVSKKEVEDALKKVIDPEIHIDIFTLGLIYGITVKKGSVDILMTFTFPGCPYGPVLIEDVTEKVGALDGVDNVNVEITFDPLWEPPDDLKATMGF